MTTIATTRPKMWRFEDARRACSTNGYRLAYGYGSANYFLSPKSNGWSLIPCATLAEAVAFARGVDINTCRTNYAAK